IFNPRTYITPIDSNAVTTQTIINQIDIIHDIEEGYLSFEDTGYYHIEHIAYNDFGCSDTSTNTVYVGVPFELYIPNAFTPNHDGNNDIFRVHASGIIDYHILVFNKWGECV